MFLFLFILFALFNKFHTSSYAFALDFYSIVLYSTFISVDDIHKLKACRFIWKLVDTTKEYEDGYVKCIQVQQNPYRAEMHKQKYKICRLISTKM